MESVGDKIQAKVTAKSLGLPLVPGSDGPITSLEEAKKVASDIGYPVLVKAAAGGGGGGPTRLDLGAAHASLLRRSTVSRTRLAGTVMSRYQNVTPIMTGISGSAC